VHITDLGADYFQYDDARHELRGERTGKRYQLTDKVKVQVVRVDLDTRKIDLRLAASETAGIGVRQHDQGGARIKPLYEEEFDGEEEQAPRGRRKPARTPAAKGAPAGKAGSRTGGAVAKGGAAPKSGGKTGAKAGTHAGAQQGAKTAAAGKLPAYFDLEPLPEPLVPPPRSRSKAGAKPAATPKAGAAKPKAAKPKRSKIATAAKSKKKR
jgi:ribonuclease R